MARIAKVALGLFLVVGISSFNVGAQSQSKKGESSSTAQKSGAPTSKTSSDKTGAQKGSSGQATATEKQQQTKGAPPAPEKQLSPEQKQEATRIQIVSLDTNTNSSPGSVLIQSGFKVDLPEGIVAKGFEAVFETRFSNGETKRETVSISADRREAGRVVALPVVNKPAFDCNVCANLQAFKKDERQAIELQCRFNNCTVAPPQAPTGEKGSKSKEVEITTKSATPSAISTRSANGTSGGTVFSQPASVKVTVTGRFADGRSRVEFTRTGTRTLSTGPQTSIK